ncbi:MAG: hypothetical protein GYA30_05625 [Chloroflexi bacterium]|mgnify:CR=1 FL=1|nr:hypothetical protein [Chloroflexota bacterium]HOC20590.1 hypothetical protein [Anaerolineae bacterium]HOS79057.1 hypothetical protein [Anaerolineae bacterium]HQE98741.1 hypothetical protein [Anaerolineae bacterium]HQJ11131.1 hypothetical protein [Anaerolineae bacterium]
MADQTLSPLQHELRETLAQGGCPLCHLAARDEQRFLDSLTYERILDEILLQDLRFPEVQAALVRAGGLCLPHLRTALGASGPAQSHTALLAAQREAWTVLMAELDGFIRKNDYRFQHEPMGDERDAWLRVLDTLTGLSPR